MSKFLQDVQAFLSNCEHEIFRVAEIRGKQTTAELIELYPATPCQNIYSIAKAFTVTAVGMLSDRGLLSVDEFLPAALGKLCPKQYHPRWNDTTLHMLLQHRVGLPEGCLDIDVLDGNAFGEDFLHYTMNLPLAEDHGTVRHYTDAAFYLLSCVVENRSGMPLDDFLWQELFRPLAFRDAAWSHCPKGHAMGATGLYVRVTDTIKLGSLYMNGGLWGGKRLLSEEWIQTVKEHRYEFSPYAFGDAYGKGGMLGQQLFIIPHAGRTVAWQAASKLGQKELLQFVCEYPDEIS